MSKPSFRLANLAAAAAAGPWSMTEIAERLRLAAGGGTRWRNKLARQLTLNFPAGPPADFDQLLAFVISCNPDADLYGFVRLFVPTLQMAPVGLAAAMWGVPALPSAGALSEWLGLFPRQLFWLADTRGINARAPTESPLRHYRYRWQRKPSGAWRLLEVPKPLLKLIQRRILAEILDRIPTHDTAHGFRKQRSILTYAMPHVGADTVVRFDLRDFFPTSPMGRVFRLFRTAGYPATIARLLTGLCSTRLPEDEWQRHTTANGINDRAGRIYSARHLPQGAPTSQALANAVAYRLDVRLTALANALGATYTRYADDLAFSGSAKLASMSRRLIVLVGTIAAEEGYELNYRKCRVMRRGTCQHVAGVVVNDKVNCRRDDFDRLKAVLTNCIRHGPTGQNREGHPDFRSVLTGRVAHIALLNPQRGAKLAALVQSIDWEEKEPP